MSKKWIYAVITAAGLTMALATPAAAHVITDPGVATQGGHAAFAFLVPNERTDAGTVKLEVTLPTDHPIGSVYTKPLAGWTAQVVKEGDAVRRISWTANKVCGSTRASTKSSRYRLTLCRKTPTSW
jgi:uncharacterized protein YcnI